MSYLHCPVCGRAFNLAKHASCPSCPAAATVVDPVADLVAAADTLARALARATPAPRAEAAERLDLPGRPAATPALAEGAALLPIRRARAPVQQFAAPGRSRWLAALAASALDRISPHAPKRLVRAARAAVRAFAA
jgi:hypothetical protein